MSDMEAYWEKERDLSIPESAVQFPVTWGKRPDPQAPPVKIRLMRWTKDRFEIEWENGEKYSREPYG